MHPVLASVRSILALCLLTILSSLAAAQTTASDDKVIQTVKAELAREQGALSKQPVAPYYMSYNVGDDKTVKVAEEDSSGDFSKADASNHYYEPGIEMSSYFTNRAEWESRLRKYSALFVGQKDIFEAKAMLEASVVRKYFVSSEGGEIVS